MNFFESVEKRIESHNGEERTVEKRVKIRNGEGTKTVIEETSGKKPSITTVPLSPAEIKNIEGKNFVVGFWNNCAPGMPCYNNGGNNNNNYNNYNNNNNNNYNNNSYHRRRRTRRHAAKNRTRKQRRQ